jgi:hypothetical protein
MSLMNKSCRTLTHISLPAVIDIPDVVALLPLFDSYFPSLTSFHLGRWLQNPDPTISKAMTQFLIAHPLIRHLSIGLDPCNDGYGQLIFSESAVTSEMLPHLEFFHGCANSISIMARRGVRSLQTVTALSVDHIFDPDNSDELDVTAMFLQLERVGGLPELKEFRLEPSELTDVEDIHSWMAKLSTVCPGIERLSGALGEMSAVSHVIFVRHEFELIACYLGGNSVFVVIFPSLGPD